MWDAGRINGEGVRLGVPDVLGAGSILVLDGDGDEVHILDGQRRG